MIPFSGCRRIRYNIFCTGRESEIDKNQPPRAQSLAPPRIIGVACGAGAPDLRCADGPDALRRGGLVSRLLESGLDAAWSGTIRAPTRRDALPTIASVSKRLARRTATLIGNGRLPVILGGDHSCALGTWKGAARALSAHGKLGLIWIDAHMDAHTPRTTRSGKLHGMPVACLLGHGDPRLTAIAEGARLDPQRVCLVGVRSFESGEAALLRKLGVRVFFMHEVERRGLAAVMKDAIAIARGDGGHYGISLDLDALDPRDAPGVGTPVTAGIRKGDLLLALLGLARDGALACVEIVEYNPHKDREGITARLVGETLLALFAPQKPTIESIEPARRVAGGCSGLRMKV